MIILTLLCGSTLAACSGKTPLLSNTEDLEIGEGNEKTALTVLQKLQRYPTMTSAIEDDQFAKKNTIIKYATVAGVLFCFAELAVDLDLEGAPTHKFASLFKLFVKDLSPYEVNACYSVSGTLATSMTKIWTLFMFGHIWLFGSRSLIVSMATAIRELDRSNAAQTLALTQIASMTAGFTAFFSLIVFDNVHYLKTHGTLALAVFIPFIVAALSQIALNCMQRGSSAMLETTTLTVITFTFLLFLTGQFQILCNNDTPEQIRHDLDPANWEQWTIIPAKLPHSVPMLNWNGTKFESTMLNYMISEHGLIWLMLWTVQNPFNSISNRHLNERFINLTSSLRKQDILTRNFQKFLAVMNAAPWLVFGISCYIASTDFGPENHPFPGNSVRDGLLLTATWVALPKILNRIVNKLHSIKK